MCYIPGDTMTNPNQMCEVLLFVCSKMADETNLNSKLPIADRKRGLRKKALLVMPSLAFHCTRFCSDLLILFVSYSPAPLLMRPHHFARSSAIWSYDSVDMLKYLRESLRVSLHRFF